MPTIHPIKAKSRAQPTEGGVSVGRSNGPRKGGKELVVTKEGRLRNWGGEEKIEIPVDRLSATLQRSEGGKKTSTHGRAPPSGKLIVSIQGC